jgi:hypothetical protein
LQEEEESRSKALDSILQEAQMDVQRMSDEELLEALSTGSWASSDLLSLNRELVRRYRLALAEWKRKAEALEKLQSKRKGADDGFREHPKS